MVLRIEGIRCNLGADEEQLKEAAAAILGIDEALLQCRVVRRSIDARRNRPPVAVYILDVRDSI
jgi:hypothetical protein